MKISADTSPELAIKIAYEFALTLRRRGASESAFLIHLDHWVEQTFEADILLPYLRAGFTAGYHADALPWVRQVALASGAYPEHRAGQVNRGTYPSAR